MDRHHMDLNGLSQRDGGWRRDDGPKIGCIGGTVRKGHWRPIAIDIPVPAPIDIPRCIRCQQGAYIANKQTE